MADTVEACSPSCSSNSYRKVVSLLARAFVMVSYSGNSADGTVLIELLVSLQCGVASIVVPNRAFILLLLEQSIWHALVKLSM